MKTVTFTNGMVVVNEDGKPAQMERVGTSLTAEQVQEILRKHGISVCEDKTDTVN